MDEARGWRGREGEIILPVGGRVGGATLPGERVERGKEGSELEREVVREGTEGWQEGRTQKGRG